MSSTIFFSWQSDRPSLSGRNFIERALKDAVKRLKVDTTVEDAPRGELLIDRDTLNVPGSPPIFETILTKIEEAIIFVPDLTFVGRRDNGAPVPNPNVLVEYGFALSQHGHQRIIGVANAAYGELTRENMPFNLGHIRLPIQYSLHENADEELRKTARATLSKELEVAIRMVFASENLKAPTEANAAARPRTALDEAEAYASEAAYQAALNALGSGTGLEMVRANVRKLFAQMEEQCTQIRGRGHIELEAESKRWGEREVENFCTVRGGGFSMTVAWVQPYAGTSQEARLVVLYFQGTRIFPSELGKKMYLREPERLRTKTFIPSISRQSEIGWASKISDMQEAAFISNSELADTCLAEFIQLLRRGSR